jgi:hypothetical protein
MRQGGGRAPTQLLLLQQGPAGKGQCRASASASASAAAAPAGSLRAARQQQQQQRRPPTPPWWCCRCSPGPRRCCATRGSCAPPGSAPAASRCRAQTTRPRRSRTGSAAPSCRCSRGGAGRGARGVTGGRVPACQPSGLPGPAPRRTAAPGVTAAAAATRAGRRLVLHAPAPAPLLPPGLCQEALGPGPAAGGPAPPVAGHRQRACAVGRGPACGPAARQPQLAAARSHLVANWKVVLPCLASATRWLE